MIAIVDTGGANHASILNALKRLDYEAAVTLDPKVITAASHLILPGVGHAGFAMEKIRHAGLVEILRNMNKPVLGICLGMQILFSHSEEGDVECLGIAEGRVRKLTPHGGFRVPHMGWNSLRAHSSGPSPILDSIPENTYFYFVHSYASTMNDSITHVCQGSATGPEIPAVMHHGLYWGVQFHPERSGPPGAQILKNFLTKGRA